MHKSTTDVCEAVMDHILYLITVYNFDGNSSALCQSLIHGTISNSPQHQQQYHGLSFC